MKRYKVGEWREDAKVLCLECHGPKIGDKVYELGSEEWEALIEPIDVIKTYDVTYCDSCKSEIQVRKDIAEMHNLMKSLRNIGIPSSVVMTLDDKPTLWIKAMDNSYYSVVKMPLSDNWALIKAKEISGKTHVYKNYTVTPVHEYEGIEETDSLVELIENLKNKTDIAGRLTVV